jgi:hypothetical protein
MIKQGATMKNIPQVDYSKDEDMKGTLKQVVGVAAGAAAVALLPVEAPVVVIAAVTVGTGVVAAKTVGWVWDKCAEFFS